jgi:hypothetical protein
MTMKRLNVGRIKKISYDNMMSHKCDLCKKMMASTHDGRILYDIESLPSYKDMAVGVIIKAFQRVHGIKKFIFVLAEKHETFGAPGFFGGTEAKLYWQTPMVDILQYTDSTIFIVRIKGPNAYRQIQ